MGCPGQGCPWLRLNEVLGPGHSVTLPTDLHNPLLHQLYPPSPLDASSSRVWIETISCISFHVRVSFVLDCRASCDLRECSSSEVSCLLSRRYHIHWKNKPSFGLEYESSRQSSDGFHNPFSSHPISDNEEDDEGDSIQIQQISQVPGGKSRGKQQRSIASMPEGGCENEDDEPTLPLPDTQQRMSGRVRKRPRLLEGYEVQ